MVLVARGSGFRAGLPAWMDGGQAVGWTPRRLPAQQQVWEVRLSGVVQQQQQGRKVQQQKQLQQQRQKQVQRQQQHHQ